ncbi:MAG: hypothetical protein Q4C67_07200 [Deinococcus sp.]|nr:hypothetical protein [Deinococcus sp.]
MNPKICLAALALCVTPAYAQVSAPAPQSAVPGAQAALPQSVPLTPQWQQEISAALKFTGQPCAGEYTVDRAPGRFSAAQFAQAAASAQAFTQDFQAFLPGAQVRFDTDRDRLTRFALLDTALPLFSQQERRADGVYTLNCSLAPAPKPA